MLRKDLSQKVACRNTYGETLAALGNEYPEIVVLDADLSKSTKTSVFAKKFPDRFFQAGVAESNLMGVAAGLAHVGKIPFASTFAIFATGRAWEIIRQSIAYNNLPVRVVATHAGITVGPDGASHQALEDIAIMNSIPNMQIISPADCVETEQAIKASIKIPGPIYMRLGRSASPVIFDENYKFQFGKAVVIKEGKDLTILATGIMVARAVLAAQELENQGISAEVINVSTLKPIDEETIAKSISKTKKAITVEEHSIIGGLGSLVCSIVAEEGIGAKVTRIGTNDTFGESGKGDELLEKYGLTKERIIEEAKKL